MLLRLPIVRRDKAAPARLSSDEIIMTVRKPLVNELKYSGVSFMTVPENIPTVRSLGMYADIMSVASTMLNSCPINLMVPRNPEAVPE